MEKIFGNLALELKYIREHKGWSQDKLAYEVGVSQSTVQRWEKNQVNPSRLAARQLAKLFAETGPIKKDKELTKGQNL